MIARVVCLLLCCAVLLACGSPEKYQKQQQGAAAPASELPGTSVGLELGREHSPWAQGFITALNDSREVHAAGDTALALRILDSLIAGGERSLDTLPFEDDRSKFLVLMLSDVYSQAVIWQAAQGDTVGARTRTERFQALADRIHRIRDSIDRMY